MDVVTVFLQEVPEEVVFIKVLDGVAGVDRKHSICKLL